MNFHIAHIIPPGRIMHGLNGYKEVIDTLQWGLHELGHGASYSINTISETATNIIFGAQMLAPEFLAQLPAETIVYNFEQIKGVSAANLKPAFRIAAERFAIWDYSESNTATWRDLGARNATVVPVGYAPILQRIPKPPIQDIDILMYGSTDAERLNAFDLLYKQGLVTVFVGGLYGRARDDLIGRSKLVLNLSLANRSKIFEVVRVSYLLANRKAVVAVVGEDAVIDKDLRGAVRWSDSQRMIDDCLGLIDDEQARMSLEEEGFQIIQGRDIRTILEGILGAPAVS